MMDSSHHTSLLIRVGRSVNRVTVLVSPVIGSFQTTIRTSYIGVDDGI